MLRFVILTHDHPDWHWDFMLESDGVLRTWRLAQEPSLPTPIAATPLPDHRLQYLAYEGPVSGNRGQVQRWDQGQYELLDETDDRLIVNLHGGKLQGQATLTATRDGATAATIWFQFIARTP